MAKQNLNISEELLSYGGKDAGVLKRFMQEFIPFNELKKVGFFTKEMRNDYYAQAKRICDFFGYKSVFEYGAQEVTCHLSLNNPQKEDPFITTISNIYKD